MSHQWKHLRPHICLLSSFTDTQREGSSLWFSIPQTFLVSCIFKNSFIEIYVTDHKIHPIKIYDLIVFGKFTEWWSYHSESVLNNFHDINKTLHAHLQLIFISNHDSSQVHYLPSLYIHIKESYSNMWFLISGFQSASCFQGSSIFYQASIVH